MVNMHEGALMLAQASVEHSNILHDFFQGIVGIFLQLVLLLVGIGGVLFLLVLAIRVWRALDYLEENDLRTRDLVGEFRAVRKELGEIREELKKTRTG